MTARTATLFLAIPLLALAVRSGNGAMTETGFDLLHASVVLLVVAALVPRAGHIEDLASKSLMPLAILAVGACAAFTFLYPPGVYLRIATPQEYLPWPALAGVSGVIGVAAVLRRPGRPVAAALVLTFAAAGAWVILKSPQPEIDVLLWHRDGLAALFGGASPYGITIPNIYGAGTAFYGPGLVEGGRVLAGYPYPPLDLLVAAPGWLAGGDHRWSYLAALAASGWLLARAGGRWGGAAAALVLLHPRALFVVEQGWTEPVTVLALSLTLWAAARRPAWVPWAAGLLVASKQHLLLLAPLALLLAPRPLGARDAAVFLAGVVGAAAATWVPFVAWDPAGILNSAVMFHVAQPFRTDALSYLPWLRQLGVTLPGWTGLAVAAPLSAVAAWRGARGRASFALWTALVLTAVFALGKQAFANYWFLVGAAACWAVATCDDRTPAPEVPCAAGDGHA